LIIYRKALKRIFLKLLRAFNPKEKKFMIVIKSYSLFLPGKFKKMQFKKII